MGSNPAAPTTHSLASPASKKLLLETDFTISSFGEDAAGDLYVLDHDGGKLYEVVQG